MAVQKARKSLTNTIEESIQSVKFSKFRARMIVENKTQSRPASHRRPNEKVWGVPPTWDLNTKLATIL